MNVIWMHVECADLSRQLETLPFRQNHSLTVCWLFEGLFKTDAAHLGGSVHTCASLSSGLATKAGYKLTFYLNWKKTAFLANVRSFSEPPVWEELSQ